jgi:hypothetical protein
MPVGLSDFSSANLFSLTWPPLNACYTRWMRDVVADPHADLTTYNTRKALGQMLKLISVTPSYCLCVLVFKNRKLHVIHHITETVLFLHSLNLQLLQLHYQYKNSFLSTIMALRIREDRKPPSVLLAQDP